MDSLVGTNASGIPRYIFEDEIELLRNGADHVFVEYEVYVGDRFVGEIEYEHFLLVPWEANSNYEPFGDTRYCLRAAHVYNLKDRDDATKKGYFPGGEQVDEIAALLALFSRTKFKVGPQVRFNDRPQGVLADSRTGSRIYVRRSEETPAPLDRLMLAINLEPVFKQKFILAARMYGLSLELAEHHLELAYINLISAVECLSAQYQSESMKDFEYDVDKERVLQEIVDNDLAMRIRKQFWSTSRVMAKFVAFIEDHLDARFWDLPRPKLPPTIATIEPADLSMLLKRIYDARSKFLHEGKPLCPSIHLTGDTFTLGIGAEFASYKKMWQKKDFIPSIEFLERLVHHVLLNFLERNQTQKQ